MNISQFDSNLEKAETQKQAEALLREYLTQFGFRSYAFTYYSGHIKTGRKLIYHYASKALRPWHVHYLEQGYADIDRVLENISKTTLPVYWTVQAQLLNPKNKRERTMREEALAFGLDHGLSVSTYGTHNDFVSLTLHQRVGETCLKHYKTMQYKWLSATCVFYHHIKRILNLNSTPINLYKLTRRETQCLLLTAKSWRVEKIAKELKISARTVNFHIQNANKKLGTNNKYQAAFEHFQIL
ncbi:MAG TPA: LuxR C-terminal-related transcriptional regulator [Gammaproteobacteria bacterium]|jgi:LuxR family transcriptional activator of bioluminescence operon|nr:LuxR C-terminal-related transcriptional regulator [Gammaproteobacteria bacterium]